MRKLLRSILCIMFVSSYSDAAAPSVVRIRIHPIMFSDTGHSPHSEDFSNQALRSIGRLRVINPGPNGSLGCTATLVAPDIIVTAAHCFIDPDTGFRNNADFDFITGAETLSGGTARHVNSLKMSAMTFDVSKNPGLDVAFMRLKKPLDPKIFPPAQISSVNEVYKDRKGNSIFLTSYDRLLGSSIDERPTTETCEIKGYFRGSHEITHNCSTRVGMSGAPIYVVIDGKVTIVGIHDGALHIGCDLNTENPIPFTPACANRASGGDVVALGLARYKEGNFVHDDFPVSDISSH